MNNRAKPAGDGLPSAAHQRQTWRPAALDAVDAAVSGIFGRADASAGRAFRWEGWYRDFSERVRGLSDHPPKALDFPQRDFANATESSTDLPVNVGQPTQVEVPGKAPRMGSAPEAKTSAQAIRDWPASLGWSAPTKPSASAARALRPAMELAVLSRGVASLAPALRKTDEVKSPPVRNGIAVASEPSVKGVTPFVPALALEVSTKARREIPGGFPVFRAPEIRLPENGRKREQPAAAPPATVPPAIVPARPLAIFADRAAGPASEKSNAIERWIEGTVMPAPLPGLQMRMLRPGQEALPIRRPEARADSPTASADGRHPAADKAAPPPPARGPSASPPPIDLASVTEQVYERLQRRQRLERERRGFR